MANAFASAGVSAENDTTTTASNAIQRWVVRRKSMNSMYGTAAKWLSLRAVSTKRRTY